MNPKELNPILYIYKKNQLVGYLHFYRGQYQFFYADEYIKKSGSKPLTPDMPLTDKVLSSQQLFTVFEQVIPEGQDRKFLERKAKSANDFELLSLLKDIYGDLSFSKTLLSFNKESYKIDYLDVKTEILGEHSFPNIIELELKIDDEKLFPSSSNNIRYPSGLSGFQNKISVIINNRGIRQRKNSKEKSYHFLKPYHKQKANPNSKEYLPHLAINEHLFMTFAKNELGFDVPYSAIIKRSEDEEYHYLVKRYDRYEGYRFSCDEFASYVNLNSEDKYLISTEQLFKGIKKYLTLKKERLILLKYYFYSMLIVHEDMHSKNLSLITDSHKILMAPLYDIATTGIYQGFTRETALSIGGKFSNISPHVFYELVKLLEVNEKSFKKAAADILLKYTDKLPEYFDKLPDVKFFKRTKINVKPQVIKSISFVDRLRLQHHARIMQFKKKGWYQYLHLES